MKPTFNSLIRGYSGKLDGLVFCYNSRYGRHYARKYVKPQRTEQNTRLGTIQKNLKALEVSEGYKDNLKLYTLWYINRKDKRKLPINCWQNVYVMLMYAMAKQLNINIATLTREQIETENLPCRTVRQAVEAGLIPQVRDYEWLTNQM